MIARRAVHGQGGAPLAGLRGIVHHQQRVAEATQQLEVVAEVLIRRDDHEGGVLRTEHLQEAMPDHE
mgnify:FL=1